MEDGWNVGEFKRVDRVGFGRVRVCRVLWLSKFIIHYWGMSNTSFSGLLAKTVLSEDHLRRINNKIDDLKKASISVVEYFHMVNKGAQVYNSSTLKQVESIEQFINSDMNDDKKYNLLLAMIFKAISINFSGLCTGLQANLKQYHVAVNVELDELINDFFDNTTSSYKKYRTRQENLIDCYKRYVKLQKTFNDSLVSYKTSLSDVKLIYNKDETLRRYQLCETNFKNVLTEETIIADRSVKCTKDKRNTIASFNSLGAEFKTAYLFVGEKIIHQAKNMMTVFCSTHKQMINDIATKKKTLEQTKIGTFLDAAPQSNQFFKYFMCEQSEMSGRYPIFLEKCQSIRDEYLLMYGRWLNDYQNYLKDKSQNYQKLMRRTHGFLCDQAKNIEKMAAVMIKDIPQYYDKLKKRVQEIIGQKSVEYMKCVNSTLEVGMRIYEKLAKVLTSKLDHMSAGLMEDAKLTDMFFKELAKQIQTFNSKKGINEQTVYQSLPQAQKTELKSSVIQKAQIIKHFLDSFGEKLSKNTQSMRSQMVSMTNQIFTSFNEIYLYSTEYQHTYFGLEFEDGIKRSRSDMQGIIEKEKLIEPISAEIATQEVVLQPEEKFKRIQYMEIKKPSSAVDIETLQKQAQGIAGQGEALKSSMVRKGTIDEPQSIILFRTLPMDDKQKKYFQFLKKKINFQEGEKLIKTYSCALYDRIILQGKLYVTNFRLCFHSYFNAANLFFGNTFLQIPKKDVIKIEKRFNAIIFDNSLAISTVNGQVFLTSFFKRNEAYKLVNNLFDLKCPISSDEETAQGEDAVLQNQEEKDDQQTTNQTVTESKQKQITEGGISKENQKEYQKPDTQQRKSDQPPIQSKLSLQVKPQVDYNNITEEQQFKRSESYKHVETRKYKKVCQGAIDNVDCLFILKNFIVDKEITINGKKYKNYNFYYKELLGEKDIKMQSWVPPFHDFLNPDNIKSDTPLNFQRKSYSLHPLPKSSIPFMPKTCQSFQDQTLHLISKDKFYNKGAPYTQSFKVHTRVQYENSKDTKKVILSCLIDFEFVKSVMVRGIIESQSIKEFNEGMLQYIKFLNDRAKKELAKLQKIQKKKIHIQAENKTIVEVSADSSKVGEVQKPSQKVPDEEAKKLAEEQIEAEVEAQVNGIEQTDSKDKKISELTLEVDTLRAQNKLLKIILAVCVLLYFVTAILR